MGNTDPLVVIIGVTASGKSELALILAQQFNGEIICADSRTVYKGMDVGTAKPNTAEQARIPHHLLDIIEPSQPFTAAEFKQRANQAINEVNGRDKLPVMVGGTGLYVDSVLYDYEFSEPGAERDAMNVRHLKKSAEPAVNALRENTLIIGIATDAEVIKERIQKRVQSMLNKGLEGEIKQLSDGYGWAAPGLNAIGYKEWQEYFAGRQTLQETQDLIIRHTIQYAKRQRTWFSRNNSIHWIEGSSEPVSLVANWLQTGYSE